jgi:hypothetical protein
MAHDNVRTPLTYQPYNGFAIFEGRHNLAIVNVKHFGFDAEDFCASLDLGCSALGQGTTGHTPVTYIPIRTGDKLDVMPLGRPHGRYAPGTKLVVVRMRAEADDPYLSIGGIRGGRRLRDGSIQCPSQKQ